MTFCIALICRKYDHSQDFDDDNGNPLVKLITNKKNKYIKQRNKVDKYFYWSFEI